MRSTSPSAILRDSQQTKRDMGVRFNSLCGRFCHWFSICLNRHNGECVGFSEPDDDEVEDIFDKLTT